jgi:Family of unknown function (DUF5684)
VTCAWPKFIKIQPVKGCSIFFAFVLLTSSVFGADETFPVLVIGSETYSKVLVTGKNKQTVFIQHEKGIATLKVKDLPAQVAQELGYAVEAPPSKKLDLAQLPIDPEVRALQEQTTQQVEASFEELKAWLGKISPNEQILLLGGIFLIYLFYCQCWRLICLKTGHRPGILIWLPVLKTFPILKAAGMSRWCFFLLLIPLVNVITGIVWCVKICNARQKSAVLALFLLLPITNILTFLYLAFSEGIEVEDTPQKFQFS